MDCEYDQSNYTQISTTESCYENFRTRSKNEMLKKKKYVHW